MLRTESWKEECLFFVFLKGPLFIKTAMDFVFFMRQHFFSSTNYYSAQQICRPTYWLHILATLKRKRHGHFRHIQLRKTSIGQKQTQHHYPMHIYKPVSSVELNGTYFQQTCIGLSCQAHICLIRAFAVLHFIMTIYSTGVNTQNLIANYLL